MTNARHKATATKFRRWTRTHAGFTRDQAIEAFDLIADGEFTEEKRQKKRVVAKGKKVA